jgi:hypothetical protein
MSMDIEDVMFWQGAVVAYLKVLPCLLEETGGK